MQTEFREPKLHSDQDVESGNSTLSLTMEAHLMTLGHSSSELPIYISPIKTSGCWGNSDISIGINWIKPLIDIHVIQHMY